ncbi:MAG: hypothetical protein B6D56_04860 [Candidatus Omnitrophica bacterium 4484_70.1]|nr:MAG: hypothetical protein B6D56_04860 [Candidatus Omnitrophica bacterium 4484_70.1]
MAFQNFGERVSPFFKRKNLRKHRDHLIAVIKYDFKVKKAGKSIKNYSNFINHYTQELSDRFLKIFSETS